jgi:hypothetical protein
MYQGIRRLNFRRVQEWTGDRLPSPESAGCQRTRVSDKLFGLFGHVLMFGYCSIELNAWKDSLAPEVDLTAATRPSALPHRLTVHLMFWWLFILLHRPFYRRTRLGNVDIDHIKVCLLL